MKKTDSYSFRPCKERPGYYWARNNNKIQDDYLVHPEYGCDIDDGNGCKAQGYGSAKDVHYRCKHCKMLREHLGLKPWGWEPGVGDSFDPFADDVMPIEDVSLGAVVIPEPVQKPKLKFVRTGSTITAGDIRRQVAA